MEVESDLPVISNDLLYEIIMNADMNELNSLCKVNRFARELCRRDDFFIRKYFHNRQNTLIFIDSQSIIEGYIISSLNRSPPFVNPREWRETKRLIMIGSEENINPEKLLIDAYNKQINNIKHQFILSHLYNSISLRIDFIGPSSWTEISSQIHERYPILTKDNIPKLYYQKINIIVAPRTMLIWEKQRNLVNYIPVIALFRQYIGFAGYPSVSQLLADIYNYRLRGYHSTIDHLYQMLIVNIVYYLLKTSYSDLYWELTEYWEILRERIYSHYTEDGLNLFDFVQKISYNRFDDLSAPLRNLYQYIMLEVPKIIPKINQRTVRYLLHYAQHFWITYIGKIPANIL